MIKSRRQLTVAKRKMGEISSALLHADEPGERGDLERLCHRLGEEIQEYEAISRRYASSFPLRSIDDLSDALIKARLYRGWSQKQLAEILGVSEQMVQKDEAGGYEKASLVRLADTADALQFQLLGNLEPSDRAAAHDLSELASDSATMLFSVAPEIASKIARWAEEETRAKSDILREMACLYEREREHRVLKELGTCVRECAAENKLATDEDVVRRIKESRSRQP